MDDHEADGARTPVRTLADDARPTERKRSWPSTVRNSFFWRGAPYLTILVVFTAFASAPSLFTSGDAFSANLAHRLLPPGTAGFPLGSDQLGRDVWARIVHGSRIALVVGFTAVVVAGLVGSVLGVIAGRGKGILAALIMRVADMVLAIPFFLLAILVVAILGPNLVNIIACLSIARWPRYARVAYAQTLEARSKGFVEAAIAIGASRSRIERVYIVPEITPSIIVVGTLELGLMVLYAAGLSFLGLGVPPPTPSWGGMLSDGQQYVGTAWWLTVFPGLALFLLVFAANILGDMVRDRLDPHERITLGRMSVKGGGH